MKKKIFLLLFSMVFVSLVSAQTNVYFLPGQGADERLFSKITLDSNFTIKHTAYTIPKKRMTMKEVAQSLVNQIDTTKKFYLVGTSLGGD